MHETDEILRRKWVQAVRRGNVDEVRGLFEEHPSLTELVNQPLFAFDSYAIFECRRNLPMVDLLLEYGADLNLKTGWWAGGFGILEGVDRNAAEPLIDRGAKVDIWAAVSLDDATAVQKLLAENPNLIQARGGDGKHPLHYAHSVEMVDLLINHGADVHALDIDHKSSPIQYLVNSVEVVRRLLDHGAAADVFLAAATGDEALVRRCIQQEPDCTEVRLGAGAWSGHIYNWMLGHDLTPQDVARERGHMHVLETLLASSSPQRRLAHAVWYGDTGMVEEIVRAEPLLPSQLHEADPAFLARAAWWYRPSAVAILLDLDFDPHHVGVHNSTPLDRAAFHGYADIIEMLLEHDPDPPIDFRNEFGGTPLGACIHGAVHGWVTGYPQDHVRSARMLIEAGCSFSSAWLPTGSKELDELLDEYISASGDTDAAP